MPWWEGREAKHFPLIVPRSIPMAAIAWNAEQENDFEDFTKRTVACENTRRRCFSISASPLVLDTEGVFHNQTTVTLSAHNDGELRYTLDGQRAGPFFLPAIFHPPQILQCALCTSQLFPNLALATSE